MQQQSPSTRSGFDNTIVDNKVGEIRNYGTMKTIIEKEDTNSSYIAEWSIELHCQSCVNTTQRILGNGSVADLDTQSASAFVKNIEEAHHLTEQLQNIGGLDATLKHCAKEEKKQLKTTKGSNNTVSDTANSSSINMKSCCSNSCSSCVSCTCGTNCRCTEALCHCEASSLLKSLPPPQNYFAEWLVELHCQSCINTTQRILGSGSIANLETQSASMYVASLKEAEELTEQLQNIGGLNATLQQCIPRKKMMAKETSIKEVNKNKNQIEIQNSGSLNTRKKNKNTSSSSLLMSSKEGERANSVDLLAPISSTNANDAITTKRSINSNTNTKNSHAKKKNRYGNSSRMELIVGGMTCTMCSQAVTRAVLSIPQIQKAHVSAATHQAHIEFISSDSNDDDIVKEVTEVIEAVGYTVDKVIKAEKGDEEEGINHSNGLSPTPSMEELQLSQAAETRQHLHKFLLSLLLTIPIVTITVVLPLFQNDDIPWLDKFLSAKIIWNHCDGIHRTKWTILIQSLVCAFCASFIQFGWPGWTFYRRSHASIVHTGIYGMDVLVMVGTTAAYAYGWMETLDGKVAHNFQSSSVLICFVLLGQWMNSLAVRRTSQALTQLMKLQPKTAILVTVEEGGKSPNDDDETDSIRIVAEEEVPISAIRRGDYVKILRGMKLPADGVVVENCGELMVDESAMTGESMPVHKTGGSIVLGGTLCVETSGPTVMVEVRNVGEETALSQIVALVQEAQTRAVPIQTLADSISTIFVPTVCVLSVVTYLVWYALCNTGVVPNEWYTPPNHHHPESADSASFAFKFAIACLVVSCPCALGLATPTAVMVGTGVAARVGVLIKGGESLESAAKTTAIVFDKTGTLTIGEPKITSFIQLSVGRAATSPLAEKTIKATWCNDRGKLLWLLASLERNSEHPLAKAVVEFAVEEVEQISSKNDLGQPIDFAARTGRGAEATLSLSYNTTTIGEDTLVHVAMGNRAFFLESGIMISKEVDAQMSRMEDEGQTAILASVEHELVAILGIADALKPDASATIQYLSSNQAQRQYLRTQQRQNQSLSSSSSSSYLLTFNPFLCSTPLPSYEVYMVTGDNIRTALAIAQQLGLDRDHVIAEALPSAKVQQVQKLQRLGHKVVMVGDGINDSAALAQSDVGLAIGTGAEIAAEAADCILLQTSDRQNKIWDVVTCLHLSYTIFRRIQLNMVFSLIYNCVGIPMAAGVFYPIIQIQLPPTLAAGAMALSSFSVVVSSLALYLYQPPKIPNTSNESLPHISSMVSDENQEGFSTNINEEINLHPQNSDLTTPLLSSSGTLSNLEHGINTPNERS